MNMCYLSKMYIFNDMYIILVDILENNKINWFVMFWFF